MKSADPLSVTKSSKVSEGGASIQLRGARVHNLKSVDVDIPLGSLTVVCGVSGSGKTSLAFDTLYAEGQRRYIESFSSYARQFLQRLDRPEYDSLENLPPSIAVTRKGASRNNRSIVSSTTEIDDYLRLLYSKISTLYCDVCGTLVQRDAPSLLVTWLHSDPSDRRAIPCFEIKWENATDLALQLAHLQSSGFVRLVVGEKTFNISEDNREALAKLIANTDRIFVVVDRLKTTTDANRWEEALENGFDWGEGTIVLFIEANGVDQSFGNRPAKKFVTLEDQSYLLFELHEDLICGNCNKEFPLPDQRLFSFNSPVGACTLCEGLAEVQELDMQKIVPDSDKSIREGAIAPWTTPAYEHELHELLALASDVQLDVDKPYKRLTKREREIVWAGSPKHNFGGLQGFFAWLERKKYKMHVRIFAARWHSYRPCPQCYGKRLKPEALAFKIGTHSISDLNAMTVQELSQFFDNHPFTSYETEVTTSILSQIRSRLSYLSSVGLEYLQLDRPLRTLSGGEQTRVNLTSVLGSNLVNMLYVLDEPTIGLHPSDSLRLVDVICKLRDRGNTVLVVEHEPPILKRADHLIEVGPLASRKGGEVVFSGSPKGLENAKTITAKYWCEPKSGVELRRNRHCTQFVRVVNASGNNLKNITVRFPQNAFCVVSGVSGSGKSTLVNETLYPSVMNKLGQAIQTSLPLTGLEGQFTFDECILIDQGIASRSSRSVPVTLVKAFDDIRSLFAATRDAQSRKLSASNFSFNNAEGRCSTCEGNGHLEVDMVFLADIEVVCPDCHGKRFRPEVLSVRYRDQTIADVLDLSVADAIDFFRGEPKIQEKLSVLLEVGLDYIQLGQTSSTLSAGESQRLKLANYLLTAANRRALIIMDEPTTGLHFYDVERLIVCMQKLVDAGHTLIVVEHNEQVLNAADWIVDLGPGAGVQGGYLVAEGPPRDIITCRESKTAYHLHR